MEKARGMVMNKRNAQHVKKMQYTTFDDFDTAA